MRFSKYLTAAVALLMSMSCSGSRVQRDAQPTIVATGGKTLVVFFSHAGDNYAVGNIEVGNTKIVADYISDITGADQFELVIHKYDGMAYKPLCDLAKVEQQNSELPEFEGKLENLDQYTTVFIGGPVWWGTYPQVMFTFFKQYDLSGKTIIPFTTHEGSGLGRCVEDVKAAYPNATVTDGFEMYGHDVRQGRATVEQWLKSLGY
ncbi:MAG: NAD(P)H-dependent oxidoreductase [Muribaculaceae bacterium]|nr:NAD(P)H-dependent oxidoreductase [Muribaculaceae bacterium]